MTWLQGIGAVAAPAAIIMIAVAIAVLLKDLYLR